MKAGDVGPLTAALLAHLAKVQTGEVAPQTAAEIAAQLHDAARLLDPQAERITAERVQKAVERLRRRRAQIAELVKDGREGNGGRRYRCQTLTTTAAALQSRSPLELVWRNSNLGGLDTLGESTP